MRVVEHVNSNFEKGVFAPQYGGEGGQSNERQVQGQTFLDDVKFYSDMRQAREEDKKVFKHDKTYWEMVKAGGDALQIPEKKRLLQAPSKNKKISLGGACRIVGARTSLRTPKISFGARSTFSKHDCVYWGIHAGIAQKNIQGVDGGGRCQFAGVFEKYAPARGNVWASAGKIVVVVD